MIDVDKIRNAAPLLPPPGNEVVVELCNEVERLQNALHCISKDLLGDTSDAVLADMAQFAWRVIEGSASVDPATAHELVEERRAIRREIMRRKNEHTD